MSTDVYDEITAEQQLRRRIELRAERDRDAWRAVMNTAAGRYVVRSLYGSLSPLAGSPLDHASLAYREGQRAVALTIHDAVRTHAPEHLPTLFEEDHDD